MDYKTALLQFRTSQEYQPIKKTLLQELPPHIRWDTNKDNIEEIKYRSALIDGYLLCLKKLKMEMDNE